MPISDQIIRKKGGRASARGAQTRIKASEMVDKIVKKVDQPFEAKVRFPKRYEIDQMIVQAYEACVNHPDSFAAANRYKSLLKYKKENFK